MKRFLSLIPFAAFMTIALSSCKEEAVLPINTPAVNVTTEHLEPNADESGTVRAYVGTHVSAKGFNLDKVGAVKVDEIEAVIVEKTMTTLVFEIPDIAKPQQDDPYMVSLEVFDADAKTIVFKYDYFVTVPVTDALVSGYSPTSGTVGTQINVNGRNLDKITRLDFGSEQVAQTEFISSSYEAIVVAVPPVQSTEADIELSISAVWEGGTIDVTSTDKFTLHTPVFAPFGQATPAALGDNLILTGQHLDLVSSIKWGNTELLISEQTSEGITFKIPSDIEKANPAVVSAELFAEYGTPAQKITIIGDFKIDTTPIGPAAPVFTSVTPADEGYNGFYLGRKAIVRGENFASIEKFEIDGIEVPLSGEHTDIQAQFTVPAGISGTVAKDVPLIAIWNGGNRADFGTIKLHPFYYTQSLKLALGSNSKSTYPAYNAQNAFLLLDEGRVISTSDWNDLSVDPPAKSGTNTVVTASNKVSGSREDYYSAKPYMFATASSTHKLAFQNPANSSSQLKCHRLEDGTSLPSTYGTPVIFMRIMGDGDLKAAVAAGTLEDILSNFELAGASAPAFGTTEGSTWVKGSVIGLQYLNYEFASTTGGKPTAQEDIYQIGYMYIRDINCGDPSTGLAIESREGYIEIDLYWSQVLN